MSELLQKNEKLTELLDQTTVEMNEASQKVKTLEKDAECVQVETDNLKVTVLELQKSLSVIKTEQKDSEVEKNALTLDTLKLKQDFEQSLAEKVSLSQELRSMKEMLKQAQNEKESSLELLETERKCSQMKTLEKDTAVQKTVEQQIELTQLKERNMLLQKENASMQKDISAKDSANNLLQKELEDKSGVDHEGQKQEELQAQKTRYEAKVREIHDTLTTKYKAKVEECIEKWKADIKDKEKKHKEEQLFMEKQINDYKKFAKNSEDKYSLAKKKLEDVVSKMDEVASALKNAESENSHLKKRLTIQEVKIAELESKPSSDKLLYENQQLQKEIKRLKSESRSLQVQCSAADTKLRELQKTTTSNSKSASNLTLKSSSKKDSEGFTMPSTKHTPGRTRASRTQSEVTMPRRPPQGSGAIFKMDEEDGEMFSSSYLTDLKAGVCAVNGNGRISELARRNTMQPAHLKSSYPAETQFRPATEFTDDDLRLGKIQQSLSNMSVTSGVDSPAMNTRRQSSVRLSISDGLRSIASRKPVLLETPPQPSGLRPRKRPSMTAQQEVENDVAKKPRKELSYSKPGPPTPARKHNRSANSSLNTSGKSNQSIITTGSAFETPAKAHDRTPLLDSTNKSNRSLRSLKTPASLKKMMTRAFRKDKDKYKVKGSLNTPLRNM